MVTQIRHGDVFLVRVSDPPARSAQDWPHETESVVLAHGELTGHAHVLTGVVHKTAGSESVVVVEPSQCTWRAPPPQPISAFHFGCEKGNR